MISPSAVTLRTEKRIARLIFSSALLRSCSALEFALATSLGILEGSKPCGGAPNIWRSMIVW